MTLQNILDAVNEIKWEGIDTSDGSYRSGNQLASTLTHYTEIEDVIIAVKKWNTLKNEVKFNDEFNKLLKK